MRPVAKTNSSLSWHSSQMKRLLPFAIMVIVAAGALMFALNLQRSIENSSAAAARPLPDKTPAIAPAPGAEPAHVRGPANAPLTLEEFADFQCPACGNVYPVLKSIENEYGSRVRVIFREFPLTAQHQHANSAAQAAEAAGLQDKFWEMHDLLYENRAAWVKAVEVQGIFEEYAQKLGLDMEQFKQDQASEIVQNRISLDHQRARSIRVGSTPSLYVNGVEIPYAQMKTVEGLQMVVSKALNSTKDLN